MDVRMTRALFLTLLASCSGGGGASEELELKLIDTNVNEGQTRSVNAAMEFTFDQPIDPQSLSLTSFRIEPLPQLSAGAPVAGPVWGDFYLIDDRRVVFQPFCPDSANPRWGLTPGNELGAVAYSLTLPAEGEGIVRGINGASLKQTIQVQFQTASSPAPVIQDPRPQNPPRLENQSSLPGTLPLNLFSNPNPPIEVMLDQPINMDSLGPAPIKLFVEDSLGIPLPIPSTTTLAKNCTEEGGALFLVTPLGILPEQREVFFSLDQTVSGLGTNDRHPADLVFHSAQVEASFQPLQKDTYLESFDSEEGSESNPETVFPVASWGNGRLEASPPFPGDRSEIIIEIGPGSTNGKHVFFDTSGAILKDTSGKTHFFADGIIEVKEILVGKGGWATFTALGPNPMVIRATEKIKISNGSRILALGQAASDVKNIGVPTSPSPGGSGRAGGGDGGAASWKTTEATPFGETGKGAYQVPEAGGKGGHSAYQATIRGRGAGGGGGSWNIRELLPDGNYTEYCYGPSRFVEDCQLNAPNNCISLTSMNNSNGEAGSNGMKADGSCRPCKTILGDPVCHRDAVTKKCWAQGGEPGPDVFQDGDPANDFVGRKPITENGQLVVITGELERPQGGQGGGGGGDTIAGSMANRYFPSTSIRAAGGGGGGGVIILQSLGEISIAGGVSTSGGRGGMAEITYRHSEAGGGGGGAGGMILLEAPSILLSGNSWFHARGGNRGKGSGTLPGAETSGSLRCRLNTTACKGGAGGQGVIQIHVPFEDPLDPASQITCGGITQPKIKPGSLRILDGATGILHEIQCERDLHLPGGVPSGLQQKFYPLPHILAPTFGAESAGQSKWVYLGASSIPFDFSWDGADPDDGMVQSGFQRTLMQGSGGILEQSEFSIRLHSPELANLIRSEPAILLGNLFRPTPGIPPHAITAVEASGDEITLSVDGIAGPLEPAGDWEILETFFLTTVDGQRRSFPSSATTRILFQGSQDIAPGAGKPDPATFTPWSPIPPQGVSFLRFQVIFNTNANGQVLTPQAPRPGLDWIRIPLSF